MYKGEKMDLIQPKKPSKEHLNMTPKEMDSKWCIEVNTEEFGKVLLLDKSGYPIPLEFDNKKDALEHIQFLIQKGDV